VKFSETRLKGAYIVEPECLQDERGFFARTFCNREFQEHRIEFNFVQCNISFNKRMGTLRGMHYQAQPHAEAKLVRCTMGAIYDVIVDLRPDALTFMQWTSTELTAENRKMLFLPEGFAHGFQTLKDDTEVFYQMSRTYHPESARGLRWDDPAIGINWPLANPILSARDLDYRFVGH
jgi:dTDP-4-dehydrorhamnose 3,5-epimerase